MTVSRVPLCLTTQTSAVVMLIRNIDTYKGLVNGSKGVIVADGVHMGDTSHFNREYVNYADNGGFIRVRIFSNNSLQDIPRVKFPFTDDRGLGARRFQIPLALCFAMTYHRAQGLTLKNGQKH